MRRKVISCLTCLMIFATVFFVKIPSIVSAGPITVPDDYLTIQGAIDAANPGDTIYVHIGTYYENLYINKTLNLFGEDRDNTIIDGGRNGDVININANWVNVSGFTIIKSGSSTDDAGLKINSDYNTVSWNIVSYNLFGIYLESCSGNKIIGNNAFSNYWTGIYLVSSSCNLIDHNLLSNNHCGINLYLHSNNNTIFDNNASYNHCGISISFYGRNNTIINNEASNNEVDGIALVLDCTNNIIANNIVSNNLNGVDLWDFSNDNTIFNNTFFNNSLGIYTGYSSTGNVIYHNNIINNLVYDPSRRCNDWYHPILLEGNYWSDYSGVDDGSGTGKHAFAGDGIGDTLIPHPRSYYDFYPFIHKDGWKRTNSIKIATINIDPDTLNLKSRGRWITCYTILPEGYDINDIDISTIILEDKIPTEWGDVQNETLMIKFDRSDVQDMLSPGTYNLKVSGELTDGTVFEGYSDEIRIIEPP